MLCENIKQQGYGLSFSYTICLGSSDPFYIVTYYIKWVTTSWTYSRMVYNNNKNGEGTEWGHYINECSEEWIGSWIPYT